MGPQADGGFRARRGRLADRHNRFGSTLNEPHRGFRLTDGATNTWSGRTLTTCFLLRLRVAQHFT
jgi:hypothetical protein